MPALLGYLVAVTMLLGGAYAGLHWLSTPEQPPAVPVLSKNLPEKIAHTKGDLGVPANGKGEAATTTVKPPSTAKTMDKAEKTEASLGREARCAPIGVTANGDLVFSLQCQDLIERHHGELASSAPTQTGPGSGEHQMEEPAKPNASGQAMQPGGPEPFDDNGAHRNSQGGVATGESTTSPANSNAETNRRGSAKQKPPLRTRPDAILRSAKHHDPARQQRSLPLPHTGRMAARANSELWYNVLGLR
jgi:hypothetical protein